MPLQEYNSGRVFCSCSHAWKGTMEKFKPSWSLRGDNCFTAYRVAKTVVKMPYTLPNGYQASMFSEVRYSSYSPIQLKMKISYNSQSTVLSWCSWLLHLIWFVLVVCPIPLLWNRTATCGYFFSAWNAHENLLRAWRLHFFYPFAIHSPQSK